MMLIDVLCYIPLAVLWWALRNDEKGYRVNLVAVLHLLIYVMWLTAVVGTLATLCRASDAESTLIQSLVSLGGSLAIVLPILLVAIYWNPASKDES